MDDLIRTLREKHSSTFECQQIAWRLWASQIAAAPLHTQQSLIDSVPPPNIIQFFRAVPNGAFARLQTLNHSAALVQNFVEDMKSKVESLRNEMQVRLETIDQTITLYQRMSENLQGASTQT